MRLGCGYPMGPLALLDLIGLDTAYEILDTMYKQGRDRLHAPAPIIKQMVTAGMRGRKSGRGFYTYAAPGSSTRRGRRAHARRRRRRGHRSHGEQGRSRRLRDDGHRDHRGVREVRLRHGLRGALGGEGRGRAGGDPEVAGPRRSDAGGSPSRRGTWPWRGSPAPPTSEDLADVDLVVEAVVEEVGVKTALFSRLDEIAKPGTVLATTTSSLPVVEMAAATTRPEDVIGMHFFNPAAVMKLVEVVTHVSTAPDVVATISDVCLRLGKHAVHCGDRAGFIVNALLFPYLNDAIKMLVGAVRDSRRDRPGHEEGLRAADGSVRAARRGGQRRLAGDPEHPLPRVPRAGLRAGADARAPGDAPGTSGARPGAASAPTPGSPPRPARVSGTRSGTVRSEPGPIDVRRSNGAGFEGALRPRRPSGRSRAGRPSGPSDRPRSWAAERPQGGPRPRCRPARSARTSRRSRGASPRPRR